MRMKATLLKGKPEAGVNHLPTEKGNDTVVHRRVSILLSATRGIIDAGQPQAAENGENSHTDNSTTHLNSTSSSGCTETCITRNSTSLRTRTSVSHREA